MSAVARRWALPQPGRCYAAALNADVLAQVLLLTSSAVPELLRLGLVCRQWLGAVRESQRLWQELAAQRWGSPRPGLRMRDWVVYYRRRHEQGRQLRPLSEPAAIENCEFVFRCPMFKDLLTPQGDGGDLHCSACDRTVHAVRTQGELAHHVAAGDCVWFSTEDTAGALQEQLQGDPFPIRLCLLGAPGCGKTFLTLSLAEAALLMRGRGTPVTVSPSLVADPWVELPIQGKMRGASARVNTRWGPARVRVEVSEARTASEFRALVQERPFTFVAVCYDATDRASFALAAEQLLPAALDHAGMRRGVALIGLRSDQRPRGLRRMVSNAVYSREAEAAAKRAARDVVATPSAGAAAAPAPRLCEPQCFEFHSGRKEGCAGLAPAEALELFSMALAPVLPQGRGASAGCAVL
eukprot:TRINITY_DN29536_c0_g1_i2.p1 TRINITY_DN29536_c0_g1~~TRINITY_DN29536_c0_g1_i2.p1  ORF type:complete len:441 (+),score=110.43 TRINITY_DN29536_c0_g1_i2:94-1323(+)